MAQAMSRPLPADVNELKPLLEGARQGRLMLQKCDSCGRFRFPVQELCPYCWSWASTWAPTSGRGEVLSFIVMHQVYSPAFAQLVPYAVARIKLAEGPLYNTNLVGIAPDEVRCGMAVEAVFEPLGEELALPMFRPAR